MPLIFGPMNSLIVLGVDLLELRPAEPFVSLAVNLADALADYEAHFAVRIRPCAQPLPGQTERKYFEIVTSDGARGWLVDIHVHRDGSEICPRQDLAFRLLPTDVVKMGSVAC